MKRDEFITEKVLGGCWHEFGEMKIEKSKTFVECKRCRWRIGFYESLEYRNLDFSTWEGFGKLWNFCRTQDKFWDTLNWGIEWPNEIYIGYIDPDKFADKVAKDWGWEGE